MAAKNTAIQVDCKKQSKQQRKHDQLNPVEAIGDFEGVKAVNKINWRRFLGEVLEFFLRSPKLKISIEPNKIPEEFEPSINVENLRNNNFLF